MTKTSLFADIAIWRSLESSWAEPHCKKTKISLAGTQFANSDLPAAGNIFAVLISRRSNAFCRLGVEDVVQSDG